MGAFVTQLADVAWVIGPRMPGTTLTGLSGARCGSLTCPDGLTYAQAALKAGGVANGARAKLTDVVLRRLQGLPDDEEEEANRAALGSLGADEEDDDEAVLGD